MTRRYQHHEPAIDRPVSRPALLPVMLAASALGLLWLALAWQVIR